MPRLTGTSTSLALAVLGMLVPSSTVATACTDAPSCHQARAVEAAGSSPTKHGAALGAAWLGAGAGLLPGSSPTSEPRPYPARVRAVYYMMWADSPRVRLRDLPTSVNVVNLAFLQGDRLVGWGPFGKATTLADLAQLRARGVRVVLSIGGQGGAVDTTDRAGLLAAIRAVATQTPLDGIDWDIETGATIPADDVVAVSTALKADGYAITMAPNGSNADAYLDCAVRLQRAGALDMYGQQFYSSEVSAEQAREQVDEAVAAGLPASRLAVGTMIGPTADTWTVDEASAALAHVRAAHPDLRGSYLWEAGRAGTGAWAARTEALLHD